MSAPKKSARGTRSEPARRATDSRGVKKRSNATNVSKHSYIAMYGAS